MFKKVISYLKNNFYDSTFAKNKRKYILQCLAATFIVYIVLTTLSLVSSSLVIASIASTAFVIFSAPHAERARTRYVIGGYLVGFLMGWICYCLMKLSMFLLPSLQVHFDEIFGALAIGLSIFVMVILDLEHPPACSAALALIINDWNQWTIFVTFLALFFLVIARLVLRKQLIQLI